MQIGQILCQSVPLSEHDVEEILHEQKATRQRFGDAALALGKARPQQVWDAWLTQLTLRPIDLARTPSDPAALAAVPAVLAHSLDVLPLRLRGDQLVVAVAGEVRFEAVTGVERETGRRVIAVAADAATVRRALSNVYPASAAA